jgi:hypothetical protein
VASLCAANAPVSGADGEPRSDADRGPRPLHWRVRRHVDVHRTRNCRHVRHALARRFAPSRVHAGLTICLATPPGVRTVFCGTHDGPGNRGGLPGCCASSDADSRSVMPVLSHLDAAGRRTSSMLTNRCCPRASGTLAMRRTPRLSRAEGVGLKPTVRPINAERPFLCLRPRGVRDISLSRTRDS